MLISLDFAQRIRMLRKFLSIGARLQNLIPPQNHSHRTLRSQKLLRHTTRLAFETIEQRAMLAGDVPAITTIADQFLTPDNSSDELSFSVSDTDTDVDLLDVTGASSNPTLVPDGNIVILGSGSERTVTVTPASGQTGETTITLTVEDPDGNTSTSTFLVTVADDNSPPTITPIEDQNIDEDASTSALAFTIGDEATDVDELTIEASSSDIDLIPDQNIVVTGSGANRTVQVTPAGNQFGTATITLRVLDGDGGETSQTFVVNVDSVNDDPVISGVDDLTIQPGDTTGDLPFTITDQETDAESLVVTGTSSNTTLVPNENIQFIGSGVNRAVSITPVSGQSGTATITITVEDEDGGTSQETFVLTVNDSPTISPIDDITLNEDVESGAIPFVVGDTETVAESLTMTKGSSNETLVPLDNIIINGTGASRTVIIVPALNQSGTATITLTVTDGDGNASNETFVVNVNEVNDLPTISDVPDQSADEGATTGTVGFTVGDAETDASQLTVTGTSSNTTLVPNENIHIGGSGANRTVTVEPSGSQSGTATITLTVTDGLGATATETFVVTFSSQNDAPTISDVGDQTISQNSNTGAIGFTVGDEETAAESLTVTATSSNTTLVPNGNVVLGGSGASRTVTVTPATGVNGTVTITLTVQDGNGGTSTDTFVVTVNGSNTAPTISDVSDTTIGQNGSTGAIGFTVGDGQTSVDALTVTATSSNTTLVPNGNIVFGGSGANRTVTVTPASGQTGTVTITLTVQDGEGATSTDTFVVNVHSSIPTLSVSSPTVTEGDSGTVNAVFTISLSQASSTTVTVVYNTGGGNATAGADYTSASGTLTFTAGQTSATVTVAVTGDNALEDDETFQLTLSNASGATLPSSPGTATINDDDIALGTVALGDDPSNPGSQALIVQGTDNADTIVLKRSGSSVVVTMNGENKGSFALSGITRLVVFGYGGNDKIDVHKSLKVSAYVEGGDGDDDIRGGYGDDILIGGDGADVIKGRKGNDVVVGGSGADQIWGGKGSDMVVSGSNYDDMSSETLADIASSWGGSGAYASRVSSATSAASLTSSAFTSSSADDGAVDRVKGQSGLDWFLADDEQDVIKRKKKEQLNAG